MQRLARLILLPPSALLGLLVGVGIAHAAKTYRWVDAQGVVHYSDTPQPGAEQITLPTAQTYTPTPLPVAVQPSAAAPPSAAAQPAATGPPADTGAYLSCAITEPVAETALYSPDSVHVAVSIDPPLRSGDRLEVLLDGQRLPSSSPSATSLEAAQPDRGAHVLSAVVRDTSGKMLCSASAVTFYVQRPSVLSPQSPGKGH
jgi:hypothetical protein